MGGYVTSLMVSMDCDVQTHEFPELVVFEAKLVRVVSTVVKSAVSVWDLCIVSVLVVENNSTDPRNLCADVKSVFEGRFPVL